MLRFNGNKMTNQFIIWKDIRLFYGRHARSVSQHSHPIIQFVLAIDGTFLSMDKDNDWVEKKGLLIAPNHAHKCDASEVDIISIEIDPESNLGEWILRNQLKNSSICEYPSAEFAQINITNFTEDVQDANWSIIREVIENLFHYKGVIETSRKEQRIQDVVDFIENNIKKEITTKQLMEVAHLSESRLIHLFKEIKGLPVRNYILWYRLQIVLKQMLAGQSLTTAAHEAGFSDQSHLTRTFTKMIGIPPSLIARNSKFIQVSFP